MKWKLPERYSFLLWVIGKESEISGKKSMGFYWSASYFDSMVGQPFANYLFICDDTVDPADRDFCKYGYSVRLVAAVSIE